MTFIFSSFGTHTNTGNFFQYPFLDVSHHSKRPDMKISIYFRTIEKLPLEEGKKEEKKICTRDAHMYHARKLCAPLSLPLCRITIRIMCDKRTVSPLDIVSYFSNSSRLPRLLVGLSIQRDVSKTTTEAFPRCSFIAPREFS